MNLLISSGLFLTVNVLDFSAEFPLGCVTCDEHFKCYFRQDNE